MEHYYHLTKSEKANVQNDLKKMTKDLEEMEQLEKMKKFDMQKNMAKAEKLKSETEWDAEALKAWEETLKKRDDDIELIKKFSMEDARKYNELEARRQLLQVESDKKRKLLTKMVSELRNNEMIIDRTGVYKYLIFIYTLQRRWILIFCSWHRKGAQTTGSRTRRLSQTMERNGNDATTARRRRCQSAGTNNQYARTDGRTQRKIKRRKRFLEQ